MPYSVDQLTPQPNDVIGTNGASSVTILGADVLSMSPMLLPRMTIKAILLRVTTVGTAGSVVRAGLRSPISQSNPAPGQLIIDAGTQVGTSIATLTYSFAPFNFPGGIIWVEMAGQGSPGTQPTLRTVISTDISVFNNGTDPGARFPIQNAVSGALPLTFVLGGYSTIGPLAGIVAGDPRDVRYGPYA